MPAPDWGPGLEWQCRGCTVTYPSEWARDMCQREHDEDDRAARRRPTTAIGAAGKRVSAGSLANFSITRHNLAMEIKTQSTPQGTYIAAGSPSTSNPQIVKGGFAGQTIRFGSLRVSSAGR